MNEEMKAYRARWQAVAEIERQELQAASLDDRWQQLNAAIRLAFGLGIMNTDPTEEEVYQRWAKLKSPKKSKNLRF